MEKCYPTLETKEKNNMKAEHQPIPVATCPDCGKVIWWDEEEQRMVWTCFCGVGGGRIVREYKDIGNGWRLYLESDVVWEVSSSDDFESGMTMISSGESSTSPYYTTESIGIAESGVTYYSNQPTQKGGIEMFDSLSLYMALIPLAAWVFLCLSQLVYSLSLWVRDESVRQVVFKGLARLVISERDENGWAIKDNHGQKGELCYRVFGCFDGLLPSAFFWALVIGAILYFWMIGLPIIFIIVALFATRWAIRFKKKVNSAIEKCKPNKKEANGDKHIMD